MVSYNNLHISVIYPLNFTYPHKYRILIKLLDYLKRLNFNL
jgi:hypothetical protein